MDIGLKISEFCRFYAGYTDETVLKMPLKRFFVMNDKIKVLRAREKFDNWQIVNYINFKADSRDKIYDEMYKQAFPEVKKEGEKPWWEDIPPGLHLVSS